MTNDKRHLKILISIYGFVQGGGEIFPIRLANYLYKQGYDVQLHALLEEDESFIINMVNPSIKIFKCSSKSKFIRYLMSEKIQIIHTHCNANQLFVARCLEFAFWLKIRHIATSHGVYEGMSFEKAKEQILRCNKYVSKWTYVADNNAETFQKVGIPKEKCIKIGNALERPEQIVPINRSDYSIPEDAKLVTVITRAVGKKCWPECIEAVTKARNESKLNIHLVLGGLGDVYNRLKNDKLPEFVHLVGAVSNPCRFYAASDLGMLLSIRECAPLGIIEMYYSETPVVATDTGDVCEMMTIEEGGVLQYTGILIPLRKDGKVDVEAASHGINRMLTDTEYYKKCVERANTKSKEYEFSHIADKYIDVYKKTSIRSRYLF